MTKKVIALWGIANIGKSATIWKVYNLLVSKYAVKKSEYEIFAKDIRVVLTIYGIKIGIESQGDPDSRLEKSLELFIKVGCKIIVCATRTRGNTVNLVKKLEPKYEVIWFQKKAQLNSSEYDVSNKTMAQNIIKEIAKVMNT